MNFSETQSIYLQITEFVKEQILLNKWQKDEKIPSVRDLAAEQMVQRPHLGKAVARFLRHEGRSERPDAQQQHREQRDRAPLQTAIHSTTL